MAVKQPLQINFSGGLDQKDDPKQVRAGKFLRLQNSMFDTGGMLKKRNGFARLPDLPDDTSTYLTTLGGNLTAVGDSISAFSAGSMTWVSKGSIQPLTLDTLPLLRNSVNQTQADSAVAPNNLICTAYTEVTGSGTSYKFVVADVISGQNIAAPRNIPVDPGSTASGSPRVFLLGNQFIIVYTSSPGGASNLRYVTIGLGTPTVVSSPGVIANGYTPSARLSWDATVANNTLYIAYNTLSGGQSIKLTSLTAQAAAAGNTSSAASTFAGRKATIMSVTSDMFVPSNPQIYVSFYDSTSSTGYTLIVDKNLFTVLAPTLIIPSGTIDNITSVASNQVGTIYFEVDNNYTYDSSIPSHYIRAVTITQAGVVGTPYNVIRSVGLASKAFLIDQTAYFLSAYQSPFQPTYFMVNASTSTESMPIVAGKLAYGNGAGYLALGLPNVSITDGNLAQIPYIIKDLVQAVNKDTDVPAGTQVNGIYSQTGVNLSKFSIGTTNTSTAEIANDLHISGGFLWMYDSYLPVEHNFFVYPDSIKATWSATGGSIAAQPDGITNTNAYFYQVTYEWTDNQGNPFKSSPSIPISVTTTGAGSTGSITLNIPTLRLTYKVANPPKIVIYRWSVGQEIYYQTTSITAPTLNDLSVDSITYVDTHSDATILGNNIIYTNGGVLEDVNAPATNIITLFDDRLWLVDAEDPNLLWYSKQVIETTPVEMSNLLTMFIAPSTGAQGSTGPVTALAPMDDKLIIFKENAVYYINGTGPDNTGANNQYSQPIFLTSTVGCDNHKSIVFMPQGLMFQSGNGIWLLGRDLSTKYIGADVEGFNGSVVESALNIPNTNQVRFTLDTGETLMYDYYYSQWGTFVGAPGISSCIYQELHTFVNEFGQVFQESPNKYLDGSNPVLLAFTTSWLNLATYQGYQRLYEFQLLADYYSPHKLILDVAYDFYAPTQRSVINPTNFSGPYGSGSLYGQPSPYGGPARLEQWRVFANHQKCQAFQISLAEVFDPSFGTVAGAGFTMSGIACVLGIKKGFRPLKGANSVG